MRTFKIKQGDKMYIVKAKDAADAVDKIKDGRVVDSSIKDDENSLAEYFYSLIKQANTLPEINSLLRDLGKPDYMKKLGESWYRVEFKAIEKQTKLEHGIKDSAIKDDDIDSIIRQKYALDKELEAEVDKNGFSQKARQIKSKIEPLAERLSKYEEEMTKKKGIILYGPGYVMQRKKQLGIKDAGSTHSISWDKRAIYGTMYGDLEESVKFNEKMYIENLQGRGSWISAKEIKRAVESGEAKISDSAIKDAGEYIIYKENGDIKGTDAENYNARIRIANKIQNFTKQGFKSAEQAKAYMEKYGGGAKVVIKDGASELIQYCAENEDPTNFLKRKMGKYFSEYFSMGLKKENKTFTDFNQARHYALDKASKYDYAYAVKYTTQKDKELLGLSVPAGTTVWLIEGWIPE